MRNLSTRRRYAAALVAAITISTVVPVTSSAAVQEISVEHTPPDSATFVAGLDVKYQAAVKRNDAKTIGRILADDFILVTGRGSAFTKKDLLTDARAKTCTYEQQDEVAGTQTVRLYGPTTAIVTALLWEKGTCEDGSTFDARLWFSDTYVKANGHWSYVFGQASRPL
jgi:ketosteroid isomerase-like protein